MPAPATSPAGTRRGIPPITSLTLLVALASCLAACSRTGDFGRPRPGAGEHLGIMADRLQAQLPVDDDPSFSLRLRTAVEQEADDRLVHFDRRIAPLPTTSASARFNALADRIAEDRGLLPRLKALHPAIAAKDSIRSGAVAGLATLPPEAAGEADAVAAENAALFARLCRRLHDRAATYRRLLERSVVRAPELEAVPAERGLIALEADIRDTCPGHLSRAQPHVTGPSALPLSLRPGSRVSSGPVLGK